ncbi:MAG: tRNA-dihydrouridine synthase family protein [Candidatus Bathyarchaeota archaeon]|nr:tRNA-dihydrouridine synthase family protein [Candidatus Bathyarchaeota archaeon]
MFRFMLAPLEGYTDAALRTLCFRHGADLTFTEMAHVESFLRNNRLALEKIEAHDSTPVQIQLLTGREEELERFLAGFEPFPGFEGFNLNLSCPSPDVIRRGKGAAMIKRAAKTQRLVSAIKGHGYQASLKIRLGTNAYEKAQKVYLNALGGVDADLFVVHAKTAAQESVEGDDYSVFPECVEAARGRPVIANGGIDSAEKVRLLRGMGVAGVMIGRAALSSPAVFDELRNGLGLNDPVKRVPDVEELRGEYEALHASLGGRDDYRDNLLRVLGRRATTRY